MLDYETKEIDEKQRIEQWVQLRRRVQDAYIHRIIKPMNDAQEKKDAEKEAKTNLVSFEGLSKDNPITLASPEERANEVIVNTFDDFKVLLEVTEDVLGFSKEERTVEEHIQHYIEHMSPLENQPETNISFGVEIFQDTDTGVKVYQPRLFLHGQITLGLLVKMASNVSEPSELDKIIANT